MRKIFVKLLSMVLIFVMCLSSLVGCGLITTDTERDMNQVVATVQIEAGAPKEVIYKKDMIMAYLNYGYMYEQYGYSSADTFELIIDSLVNDRIYVQSAIKAQFDSAKGWKVEEYLSEDAKIEAKYSSYKAIEDLIESYEEHDHSAHDKVDTAWEEVRTVPTNATNKEEEVDKPAYVANIDANGFDNSSSAEIRKAYNKVIELLRINGLLGDDYKGDIRDSEYFKQTLKSYQESELIKAYEKSLTDAKRAEFTFDELKKAFDQKKGAQGELTNSELVEKFSSATSAEPILVGANGNYGYVYNLLLGADEVLTNEISAIKSKDGNENITPEKYAQERYDILNATVITDLRSSWIASGYDFDGAKFTGDYTFAKDATNSLAFQGSVVKYEGIEEDTVAKYGVTSLTEFNLDSFIQMMEKYVYGVETPLTDDRAYSAESKMSNASKESVYKRVLYSTGVTEYENKINELMFAFSTDPGSLNTYKGYLIKPASDTEEYMIEFAEGARELIAMGGNSYIMIATDYGYHVMFYSELLSNTSYGFESLTDYLNDLYDLNESEDYWKEEYARILKEWDDEEDTKHYLYLLSNSLSSTEVTNAVSKYQRETLNTYKDSVTLYEDRYADLLG